MATSRYLMYINSPNFYKIVKTYQEFTVEHEDNVLQGLDEAMEHVESFVNTEFSEIINAIKPGSFTKSWTRDIVEWQLIAYLADDEGVRDDCGYEFYKLFAISIVNEADIVSVINLLPYSQSYMELVKGYKGRRQQDD